MSALAQFQTPLPPPAAGPGNTTWDRARRADILGNRAEAIRLYREVLRDDPLNVTALSLLGSALFEQGHEAEALAIFGDAIRIEPDRPESWMNQGQALRRMARFEEALISFDRAVALRPDHPIGQFFRAAALFAMGRFEEALSDYRDVEPRMTRSAEIYANLAITLQALGRTSEALREFNKSRAIDPKLSLPAVNKSFLLLMTGDFKRGWEQYESRYRFADFKLAKRAFPQPDWIGRESIEGKTLLIHAEQGLGDSIQFCRYAATAQAAGARVIMATPPPLVRLMKSLPGAAGVVPDAPPFPDFDLHCSIMSLPLAFKTTVETIPAQIPYLSAEPDLAAAWKDRLAHLSGLRIGVVWAGGSRTGNPDLVATDRRRSMPFREFGALADMEGFNFISLQLGTPAEQAAAPPSGFVLHDFTSHITDFADTAGLIENLDLVISVDTSTLHLAGAMGKPVWLLNRFDTCWRWFLDREDSPWYPTMRIFRQPTSGDWGSVMRNVADALRTFRP